MHILAALIITACLGAADAVDSFGIPDWILPSILAVETSSYYNSDGTITYVDRRTGSAGELSCFQITRNAFDTVAHKGESFRRMATDTQYAELLASRYLWWIYEHTAGRNWDRAVMQYNCGPHINRAGRRYLAKCKALWK